MPVIESLIDAHSAQFAQNREAMLAAIAQLHQLEHNLLAKAQEAKPKFDKRGQLLPASASTCCWTPARRSWNWPAWPATSCTTTKTAVPPAVG